MSTDGAKSFGKTTNFSATPGVSKEPDVTVAGGKLFATWEETESGKTGVRMVATPFRPPAAPGDDPHLGGLGRAAGLDGTALDRELAATPGISHRFRGMDEGPAAQISTRWSR